MGNAHVTGEKRMGWRSSPDAETIWKQEPFVFLSEEVGVEPAHLVAEMHVDKLVRFEKVHFKWVVEDSYAAPKEHVLIECTVPLLMETLSTQCSLPNSWPVGKYRVDVFLGGETAAAGCVRFSVVSQKNQLASAEVSHEGVPFEVMNRGFGPIRVLFESRFVCSVREDSFIEWLFEDAPLLKLVVPEGSYRSFHSDLTLKSPWPIGAYRARLVLDGNVVHTKEFSCVGGWAGRVFSLSNPEGLTPDSGELYVVFDTTEKTTVKEQVEVVWLFQEKTYIARVSFSAGQYDEVKSNCKLAEGTKWPTGSYTVELRIDGALACKKAFLIETPKRNSRHLTE